MSPFVKSLITQVRTQSLVVPEKSLEVNGLIQSYACVLFTQERLRFKIIHDKNYRIVALF